MGKLVMAFSGPSNSGKTTLISKLTKEFLARKLKVAVIKHDPLKDGVQVLPTSPLIQNERDVTLTFLVRGSSQSDFLAKYAAFMDVLCSGVVTLYVPDLSSYYRLLYSNATQFENWRLNACKLSVKFREPDPTNRDAQ